MRTLTLVRHAKASRGDLWMPDFDRPLNHRGKEQSPEMGRRLAARGVRPDAVVSSPARRAWSTAKRLAAELGFPREELRAEGEVYDAEADALLEVVRRLDPAWEHVLLVGHNPGLSELAGLLTGTEQEGLPTCGVVSLGFGAARWEDVAEGSGTLLFTDEPG